MKKEETYKCIKDTPTGTYKAGVIYYHPLCALLPEYFAPYKFTTHDGVDMYGDEKTVAVWAERLEFVCGGPDNYEGIISGWLYFSTREAAQAHIDEQNKPKVEIGKPYFSKGKCLIMVTNFNEEKAFGYGFDVYGIWFNDDTINHIRICDLGSQATPAEWEAAIIKEAERRYKPGDLIKLIKGQVGTTVLYGKEGAMSCSNKVLTVYFPNAAHTVTLFHDGVWASIVPDSEKEKNIKIHRDSKGNIIVSCSNATVQELINARDAFLLQEKETNKK